MSTNHRSAKGCPRRTIVTVAITLVLTIAASALALDVGRYLMTRSQLQGAADAAATAAAEHLAQGPSATRSAAVSTAAGHRASGEPITPDSIQVEIGAWDTRSRSFVSLSRGGNAVRVTTRRGAVRSTVLGSVAVTGRVDAATSAVAAASPCDIAFVVDLSGSMNDDTEPCRDEPPRTEEMQALYDDLGFGPYPGAEQSAGEPLGVAPGERAYVELTRDGGPLAAGEIDTAYRIKVGDSESTRKQKAYRWLIERQIAPLMPAARPAPCAENFAYWEKYLDYVLPAYTGDVARGPLPPRQDADRIDGFQNRATDQTHQDERQHAIGYRTYVQFMLDFGRELAPDGQSRIPLSLASTDAPRHVESTSGGRFEFPCRMQPEHALRRSLIAAIEVIRQRSLVAGTPEHFDRVAIIGFDSSLSGGPKIYQPLSTDYEAAMAACTRLQSAGDRSPDKAAEAGLECAAAHLQSTHEGGLGREGAARIIVLLTDKRPNTHTSTTSEIQEYISAHPSPDFYSDDDDANAVLVRAARARAAETRLFVMGIGRRAEYDYLDRIARLAGTADAMGTSRRASSPEECERELAALVRSIVQNPPVRVVQ